MDFSGVCTADRKRSRKAGLEPHGTPRLVRRDGGVRCAHRHPAMVTPTRAAMMSSIRMYTNPRARVRDAVRRLPAYSSCR
jgi:hypothetical protein